MKAVVFIDVQNDFLKNGKLAFGYPEKDNMPDVIEFAKKCTIDPSCKIYATRDTHDNEYLKSLEGRKLPVEHCVEGSDGWQIADSLMDIILGKATMINKPTFGSFDLAEVIAEDFGEAGPDEIILCGYDLSICVSANASILRAKFPDAEITVLKDLCGDASKEAFDAACTVLSMQQIDVEDSTNAQQTPVA
jgi:nicotinamidase-related amidase